MKRRLLMMTALFLILASACRVTAPDPDQQDTTTTRVEGTDDERPGLEVGSFELTSVSFSEGGSIPASHSCDGANVSPALEWASVPEGAAELALVVEDIDAPGGSFIHWTLYELVAASGAISEGAVPERSVQGTNDIGNVGYGGPCPPPADGPHRYAFHLYALPTGLALDEGAAPDEVQSAIESQEGEARVTLTGLYDR